MHTLFKACRHCQKRYPACQDTCPDVAEDREEKQRRYAKRLKMANEQGAEVRAKAPLKIKIQKMKERGLL